MGDCPFIGGRPADCRDKTFYEFYPHGYFSPARLLKRHWGYAARQDVGLAARLDALAHPAAPLIAFALSQSGSERLAAGLLREELARRAQFLVRHLSRHIWVLGTDRRLSPIVWPFGHSARHDCRFPRRRARGWRRRYGAIGGGHLGSLLTTAFGLGVWLCRFPFSPPCSTMPLMGCAIWWKMR